MQLKHKKDASDMIRKLAKTSDEERIL